MNVRVSAVILAGGGGTRFWPLSTEGLPKQFLALTGQRTLLQLSYDRLLGLIEPEDILVLTSQAYRDLVAEQLPNLPPANIVGEPERKDTAAAVALAALICERQFQAEVMLVATADHVIEPVSEFHRAVREAMSGCQSGYLYTFGIRPTYPAIGFGYLEVGDLVSTGELEHYELNCFKEKPDQATADLFLAKGNYLWNSGMFVWQTTRIIQEFRIHLPAHIETLSPIIDDWGTESWSESLAGAFSQLTSISVDFAILERASRLRTVVPKFSWDDLGGWRTLGEYLPEDGDGNRVHGQVSFLEASDNIVFDADNDQQIVLVGVQDLVVARSGTRILVAHKDSLEGLKGLPLKVKPNANELAKSTQVFS